MVLASPRGKPSAWTRASDFESRMEGEGGGAGNEIRLGSRSEEEGTGFSLKIE